MSKILYYTLSVCPECLKEIPAQVVEDNQEVYMKKYCPEHGWGKTLIWQDTAADYLSWLEDGGVGIDKLPQTEKEVCQKMAAGEFSECAQMQPCTGALMTTNRCNMNCPVCFTRKNGDDIYEPDLKKCEELLDFYKDSAGDNALLELCGGEPTVREDLPQIAELARKKGFDYIQLNTNGIRLGQSVSYCTKLRESGVTTAYLGFDGLNENAYLKKYGKNLLDIKKQAVENCAKADMAVVLVTCVIPGGNDEQLGEIIAFAKSHMPTVKGVYLQPISYFGIYPKENCVRITIPEVIRRLNEQTKGEVQSRDFLPGAYEHAACTFQAIYMRSKDGTLRSLNRRQKRNQTDEGYKSIRKSTKQLWLPSNDQIISIGGMAFQDAGNIDLLRMRRCSVQIIGKDKQMIPLCTKYLSDMQGNKLFPGIA